MNTSNHHRNPVEVLAEEFLGRYRRGENPSFSEYTDQYPELAGEILEVFPALVIVEDANPLRAAPGPCRTPRLSGEGRIPERIGDFRIIREVGRGGMGVVYEAVQESLGRTVALKVLPPGLLAQQLALKRFRREARSVAALHHSNIVTVYGVGEDEGHHYYAMQFIEGQTLEAVLDNLRKLHGAPSEAPKVGKSGAEIETAFDFRTSRTWVSPSRVDDSPAITPELPSCDVSTTRGKSDEATVTEPSWVGSRFYRQVAKVGLQVAEALAYAHHQGVLHRDIKPSNLLMDREGTVWVVDFGLAKPEVPDDLSTTRDIVGTLRYMAPERFDGHSDGRGDVFSLGATLYELLTLQPAFAASNRVKLIREVLNATPLPPRSFDRRIPRDLETIVLKSMAREPSARYASAGLMADDLRRFLEDRTILARRATRIERSWRWCWRNPTIAALIGFVVTLLLYTAVSASAAAVRYKRQFERAFHAEAIAKEKLFAASLAEARASRYSRRPGQRFASLRALAEAAKIRTSPELRDEAIACFALPDLDPVYQSKQFFAGAALAFDLTRERYACLDWDGVVIIRQLADDREIRRLSSPGRMRRECLFMEFSPDGRQLAVSYGLLESYSLRIWDVDRETSILVDDATFVNARWSPAGGRIAIWHDRGPVRILDLETGRTESRWERIEPLNDVAFSPDGQRVALSFHLGRSDVEVRDVASGSLIREIAGSGSCKIDWQPDGTTLALSSRKDSRIYLHDAETGLRTGVLDDRMSGGANANFQPVGGMLVGSSWQGKMRLWRPQTGELLLTLPAGGLLGFRSDGARLASTQFNRPVIFQVADGREVRRIVREPAWRDQAHCRNAAIHPGGRLLAVAMGDGVGLWDLEHDVAIASLPTGPTNSVTFDPSGDLLAEGRGSLLRWKVEADPKDSGLMRIGPPQVLPIDRAYAFVFATGRQGRVIAGSQHDHAKVIDLDRPGWSITLGPQVDIRSISVSPDARWVATGSHSGNGGIKVWSLPEGRLVKSFPSIGGGAVPRFSPDGRWLMTNLHVAEGCRLWSVGDWREGIRVEGGGLGFSPDGRLVAVGQVEVIRLVEASTGRLVAKLENPQNAGTLNATFSLDGSRLILPNDLNVVAQVWDLRLIRRQLAAIGLDWDWPALPEPEVPVLNSAPLRVLINLGGLDFS